MKLSTGKEIPNEVLHMPFIDGYVMELRNRDFIIRDVEGELRFKDIALSDSEKEEIIKKFHEILPDIEKATKEVMKKYNID